MKAKIFFLFVIGLSFFYTGNVNAQINPGFSFSVNQGYYAFEGSQDLKNMVPMGLGLVFDFNEKYGIEYSYFWGDTKTEPEGEVTDWNIYRLEGLMYLTSGKKLVPYLAMGVGNSLVDYGLGLKYFVTDKVAFRADIRDVMPMPEHNLLLSVGFTYHFGAGKKEEVVAAAPVYQAEPEPAAPKDSDGDGVTDDKDQCPNTPAGAKVDSKGCPLDSDGDGVYDYQDQCANTPKGAGVDQRGCWVLKGVTFDTAKANIRKDVAAILDAVVPILEQNPSTKLEIQGYTDNKGSVESNQKLSERRAKSVMDYFVKKGIDKGRLTAKGFGISNPVATNDTPEGRAENRRVELSPVQ
jgi:OOP family OmpA-OmpF porin